MMDTRDGNVYPEEQLEQIPEEDRRFLKPMSLPPTSEQLNRGWVGRNDPCPCGSGDKFKRCCFRKSGA